MMVISASRGPATRPSLPAFTANWYAQILAQLPLAANTGAERPAALGRSAELAKVRLGERARLRVIPVRPHLGGELGVVPQPGVGGQHQPPQHEERVDLRLVLGGQRLDLPVPVHPQCDSSRTSARPSLNVSA